MRIHLNMAPAARALLLVSLIALGGCPWGKKDPVNDTTNKPLGSSPKAGVLDTSGMKPDELAALENGPPKILQAPEDATVYEGESVTFTLKAVGSQPMQYAWFRYNGNGEVTAVACGNGPVCTLPSVKKEDAGSYSAEITNKGGGVCVYPATLTVLTKLANANTFYIDSEAGKDGSDVPGTLEKPWKSITYAVSEASPAKNGSTFYVKAGIYNEAGVIVQKDDIEIIGYRYAPGDSPAVIVNQSNPVAMLTISGSGENTTAPVVKEMPLLVGEDRNGDTTGISVDGTTGVIIRNIAITGYLRGVMGGTSDLKNSENLTLENVNVTHVGKTSGGYGGLGISLGSMSTRFSNGAKIRNSMVLNASSEGITLNGDNNLLENSKVISNQTDGVVATDYYVMVTGNNNRILNNYIERPEGADHSGHGFSIKSNAGANSRPPMPSQNNLFEGNTAVNMGEGYAVRHRTVANNRFINNTARGSYSGNGGGCDGDGNGITIRDGAHDNTFVGTKIENVCEAILIADSREDEGPNGEAVDHVDEAVGHPSENNTIERATIKNAYIGINYYADNLPDGTGTVDSNAGANKIVDSNFENARFMFLVNRHADRMSYRNTVFGGDGQRGGFATGEYSGDVQKSQFTGCSFININGLPKAFQQ